MLPNFSPFSRTLQKPSVIQTSSHCPCDTRQEKQLLDVTWSGGLWIVCFPDFESLRILKAFSEAMGSAVVDDNWDLREAAAKSPVHPAPACTQSAFDLGLVPRGLSLSCDDSSKQRMVLGAGWDAEACTLCQGQWHSPICS